MPAAEKRARTLVKICGVRSVEEARAILTLGADAIGVVVAAGSPRQVQPDQALTLSREIGPGAVLVDRNPADPDRWALIRAWPGPVQLHGLTSGPHRRTILALHAGDPPPAHAWTERVSAWLLDAPDAGSGTAWTWARPPWLDDRPLLLAGGLRAQSVGAAIEAALPWAVDVSSGVERERGVKDLTLVRSFIESVRMADAKAGRTATPSPAHFAALA